MSKTQLYAVSAVFIAIAMAIMFHQWYYWGTPFEISDIHHETFIITFVFAFLITFTLAYTIKNRRKH